MQTIAAPARAVTGTLPLEGCRLGWCEAGSGTPVLLVHGTAAAAWGDLPGRIAAFARVIHYDRRGFGASAASPIAALSRHAGDAAALLEARGAAPAVVVGWSIGGVIAAELAIRHPQKVRALVLLEPPFWAKKHADLALLNGVVGSILLGLLAGPARGGRRFSRWVFAERDGSNSLARAEAPVRKQIAANAAAVGVEIRGGTGEHLSAAQLAAIRAPAVVMAGDRGRPFLAAGAQRLADAIPGARFEVLAGASHFLQVERSEAVAAAVRAFA